MKYRLIASILAVLLLGGIAMAKFGGGSTDSSEPADTTVAPSSAPAADDAVIKGFKIN